MVIPKIFISKLVMTRMMFQILHLKEVDNMMLI